MPIIFICIIDTKLLKNEYQTAIKSRLSRIKISRKKPQFLERNKFYASQLIRYHDPNPQLDAVESKGNVITNFQSYDEIPEIGTGTRVQAHTLEAAKPSGQCTVLWSQEVTLRPGRASPRLSAPVTTSRKCAKIIIYLVGLSEDLLGIYMRIKFKIHVK